MSEDWTDTGKEYDFIRYADGPFSPIYDVIAEDALQATGSFDGVMVDLGCGAGHLGRAVMRKTAHTGVFVDINAQAIAYAKERAERDGLTERCAFLCTDVETTGLPDGYANLIVSRSSWQFWTDLTHAFTEIWRILAPGGQAYIGGGCGNDALFAVIIEQMKTVDPAWETWRRQNHPESNILRLEAVLDALGYPYETLGDNGGKGKWVVVRKPK